MPANICKLPVTVCMDFPKIDWRQHDTKVNVNVRQIVKNPIDIKIKAIFHKTGKIVLSVESEKLPQLNPVVNNLQREFKPSDGYRKLV